MKVGKDVISDAERIKYIAENLREGVRFFVDANQGYSLRDAIKIAGVLEKYEAIFFEQPMNRSDLNGARELKRKSGIPLMLDESISSPMDVINAIRMEATDMINVKLSKSGGIHQAIKVLTVAQAAGMDATAKIQFIVVGIKNMWFSTDNAITIIAIQVNFFHIIGRN